MSSVSMILSECRKSEYSYTATLVLVPVPGSLVPVPGTSTKVRKFHRSGIHVGECNGGPRIILLYSNFGVGII